MIKKNAAQINVMGLGVNSTVLATIVNKSGLNLPSVTDTKTSDIYTKNPHQKRMTAQSHNRKFSYQSFFAVFLLVIVFLLLTTDNYAQNSYLPSALRPGSPAGSSGLSEFETISPYGGNLNFSLPLVEAGGRGTTSASIKLNINQKWIGKWWTDPRGEVTGAYPYAIPAQQAPELWVPELNAAPIQVTGAWLSQGNTTCFNVNPAFNTTLTTLRFTTPDGTSYEMRDRNTNGQPYNVNCNFNGFNRGTVFDTVDGTSATFISDTAIKDQPYPDFQTGFRPSGTLILKDGNQYRVNDGQATWFARDKNGNEMTAQSVSSYPSLTSFKIFDPQKREILVELGVQDVAPYGLSDRITYKGFGGASRNIRVSYKNLHDLLRSGQTIKTSRQLIPEWFGPEEGFYPPEYSETYGNDNFDPLKPSAVWLPDGRSYKFQYNSYGELARVEMPTGAVIEYDWGTNSGAGQLGVNYSTSSVLPIFRRMIERRVYGDGTNLDNKLVLGGLEPSGNRAGYVTEDLYDSGNNRISRTKHCYFGIVGPNDPYVFINAISFEDPWRNGKEYQTDVLGSDGTTLLRRTTSTWSQSAPSWWTQSADYAPSNNAHVVETTTLLADSNQVSKRTFAYDGFNNLTDTSDYDYGIGTPGQFVRRSHTDYLTTNSVNGINYTSDSIHILNLPSQSWVSSDSAGSNKVSFTKFEYDNYSNASNDSNHDPLLDRANISGHDAAFGTEYKNRGNVTAITGFANAANQTGGISSYRKYDIAGNPIQGIDAKGYISSLDYTDHFGSPDAEARNNNPPPQLSGQQTFAFATSSTNPAGYTTYGQFDYFTGAAVDAEDINGNVSSTFYNNDPLDRPTQMIAANNRPQFRKQTTIAYDDNAREVTMTSDSKAFNDNLLKVKSLYDKMGRTKETRQYETATDYVAAQQEYDSLGRAYKSTNPFRPSLNESPQWTISKFDSLGRVIEVKTPDNAVVTRSYSGTTTTVTDQSLKKRSGTTDAIGRLLKVNEDPTGVNYQTTYLYDVLGRLRKTTQIEGTITQNRYFMYNDLGRLIRAKQPEQIANTNLPAMTDPISGNSNWSVAYNYDDNGNISSTTDANNRSVTGIYDNLNRLTFRDYSDTATPDVTFTFDDSSVTNSRGQLTAVTTTDSSTQYTAFDELGRVKSSRQTTNGQTYNMPDYSYDLSGALVSQTYPSLRVVTTETDAIGRLSKVLSQLPSQSSRTYLSNLSYTSFGAVGSARLGNGSWESTQFDDKLLQIKQIGLGASINDTSYLKLEYDYGTTGNNGSLRQQKITVQGATTPITQTYDYDALNRLQSATETVSGSSNLAWKQTFAYDRFGNRRFDTSPSATTTLPQNNGIYNPNIDQSNNRFTVAEGYNYDNEGNLTSNPESQLFVYDAENRQRQVQGANGTAYYYYDGSGKRVRKVVGTEETIFVYDAFGKMVAEYTVNQTVTTEGTKYLTADALGSPRAITDNSGHVKSRHDYLPFGEEVYGGVGGRTTAQGYQINGDGVRQQFTGYERDGESGLDYAQARYFSSKHGRFTSVDPLTASGNIKNPQTFNRYSYGLNSPYKFTDSLGLAPCEPGASSEITYRQDCGVDGQSESNDCPECLPFSLPLVPGGNGMGVVATVQVVAEATAIIETSIATISSQVIPRALEALPAMSEVLTGTAGKSVGVAGIVLTPLPNPGLSDCMAATGNELCGNPQRNYNREPQIEPFPITPTTTDPPPPPELYGPFYRFTTTTEIDLVLSSGLVGGREPRNQFGGGLGPTVKAYNGRLPANRTGYEFMTPVKPGSQAPSHSRWYQDTPGVVPISPGVIGIPAIITRVKR